MATRLRSVTESASKRRRAAQARKTRLRIVNLRDQVDRWKTVKEDFECKNDAELAKLLIDSFLSSHGQLEPEHKKRRTSTPAVGGRFPAPEMASSISPVSSDRTTSVLESFNNHLLMYAAKRQAFLYPVYKCRCQLAAIDYMEHLDRPYKRNKNGEIYYNRTYSKAANHFTVHKVKAEKEYKYIKILLQRIVEKLCGGGTKMTQKITLSADDPKRISKTIAPFTPPSTKELAERQQPRLEKAPKPGTSSDPF